MRTYGILLETSQRDGVPYALGAAQTSEHAYSHVGFVSTDVKATMARAALLGGYVKGPIRYPAVEGFPEMHYSFVFSPNSMKYAIVPTFGPELDPDCSRETNALTVAPSHTVFRFLDMARGRAILGEVFGMDQVVFSVDFATYAQAFFKGAQARHLVCHSNTSIMLACFAHAPSYRLR